MSLAGPQIPAGNQKVARGEGATEACILLDVSLLRRLAPHLIWPTTTVVCVAQLLTPSKGGLQSRIDWI